jgi:hypothetical protein
MKNVEGASVATTRAVRSSRRWPLIIVALLAGHVLLMAVACTIAIRDKSFAVVPDYYGKALEWDQQKAEQLASTRLGWHVQVQAGRHIDAQGRRTIGFVVTDSDGKAIEGATLQTVYFHHARADQIQQVTLTADSNDPRRFPARLSMAAAGNWEFHFTVAARGQSFVSSAVEYLEND